MTFVQELVPALSASLRPLPPFLATSLACCTALLVSLEFSPPCLRSTLIVLCPSLALFDLTLMLTCSFCRSPAMA